MSTQNDEGPAPIDGEMNDVEFAAAVEAQCSPTAKEEASLRLIVLQQDATIADLRMELENRGNILLKLEEQLEHTQNLLFSAKEKLAALKAIE